jgi:hypothetical protein
MTKMTCPNPCCLGRGWVWIEFDLKVRAICLTCHGKGKVDSQGPRQEGEA